MHTEGLLLVCWTQEPGPLNLRPNSAGLSVPATPRGHSFDDHTQAELSMDGGGPSVGPSSGHSGAGKVTPAQMAGGSGESGAKSDPPHGRAGT